MDAISLAMPSAPAAPGTGAAINVTNPTDQAAPSASSGGAALSERDIALVQESFQLILPVAEDVGVMFYGRLFELNPSLQSLFHVDIRSQSRALMGMFRVAVASLTKLDQIVPALQTLGRKHADYGVKNEDYATGATALLWTLEHGLGDAYRPELGAAWLKVYTLVVDTMMQAAADYRRAELVSA